MWQFSGNKGYIFVILVASAICTEGDRLTFRSGLATRNHAWNIHKKQRVSIMLLRVQSAAGLRIQGTVDLNRTDMKLSLNCYTGALRPLTTRQGVNTEFRTGVAK